MTATIRALSLVADRKLELVDLPKPPPPGAGEVQVAIKAVALNHIDVWGFRDRKSTRLNSSHIQKSRMPSSA